MKHPRKKPDMALETPEGAIFEVCSDGNRDYPDFLHWSAPPDRLMGVAANSRKLRSFLRKVLARLEGDAKARNLKD